MIKNFKDFFDKSNKRIVESASTADNDYDDLEAGIAFDTTDMKDAENFVAPNMVADDKYLAKISMIVLKHLVKRGIKDYMVHPFVLTVNGKDCAMLKGKSTSLVLFKNGIEKTICLFNGDPVSDGGKSVFNVSTRKLGFLAMVRSLADFLGGTPTGLNEAKTTMEISPAVKPSYAAYGAICKKLNDPALPKDAMHEMLKLYEKYEDSEIKSIMISPTDELPEGLQIVQRILCTKKGSIEIDATATYRAIQVIHMILCGVTFGASEKEAKALQEQWFWGAGKTGKLAIEFSASGGYVVKEAEGVLDEKADALQAKMDAIYNSASAVCKYIKTGGKYDRMGKYIGVHRGILITGVAGIGKSVSLNRAIKDNNLIENVDYKKIGGTTGAREMYHQLYEGNNMLLVFDDTPAMFDTEAKISLWKFAMESEEANRMVMNPDGEAKKNSSIFYNASDPNMTRQDRYFREIGKFSPYEKEEWLKKEKKKIRSELTSAKKTVEDYKTVSEKDVTDMALRNFKEFEENSVSSMIPDRFIFNGIIVYISNNTLATFKKSVKDHWDALHSRMEPFDISPTKKVVWVWLRRKIVADFADSSKPDALKILPTMDIDGNKIDTDAVLAHIDAIMNGDFNTESAVYGEMNFRIVSNIKQYLWFGSENWKDQILNNTMMEETRE